VRNSAAIRPARTCCFALALTLTACTTLGPNYEEPDAVWLGEWQSDLYGQLQEPEQESELDLGFWWRLFDDPILNQLIATAREENPGLRIAGLRILEARAQLGIAGSALYPQVQQATGSAAYIDTRQSGGRVNNDQSFNNYQADISIGWEMDFWGRFARGIESADAAYLASITNQHDVQVLLSAQVADLYFAYRTTLASIAIANKNAEIQKRSLQITTSLYDGGEKSELDLQQAKTQYLATLSTIPGLEINLTQLSNALAALLGRSPGNMPELATAATELPTIDDLHIDTIPARLLTRRPDVRTAAWQVATQSAQIGIAEADYYPSISLLGTVGWSANSQNGSPDTSGFGGGPAFSWNIFDHGRIENNIRVQDARLQQSIEGFQNSVLLAAQEIDNAAINVVKTHELRSILDQSVVSSRRSLTLANTLYVEGYADFQRVLDAQRAFFAQSSNELVNRGKHIGAVISLYKALGGGWTNTPIDQLIPASTRETMQQRSDWGDLLSAPLAIPTENASGTSK
jgi:NodT family efflux transporter outer membrane factor (OMF) lipoprotein